MINESSAKELALLANRVTQMEKHLDSMMTIIKGLVGNASAPPAKPTDQKVVSAIYSMTAKQHVALQMMIAGCSNGDIAKQMKISENTAKVHVRSVFSKLEVKTRAQAVAKVMPVLDAMGAEAYLEASGGIPIDWAENYRLQDRDPAQVYYL